MALAGAVLIGYSMRGRGVERVAAAATQPVAAPTVAVSSLPELPTPVADLPSASAAQSAAPPKPQPVWAPINGAATQQAAPAPKTTKKKRDDEAGF
jgi:hypothetical protein